jgi:hypothetical protein
LELSRNLRMLRKIILLLFVIAVIVLLWMTVGGVAVATKEKKVNQKWQKTLNSMESFASRYPKTSANDVAQKLERMTAEIGIDIAPKPFKNRSRPSNTSRKEFDGIKSRIKIFVKEQLEKTTPDTDPFPNEIEEYLNSHSKQIQKIIDFLGSGKIPVWESDINLYIDAPIPNLLGQLELQRVLSLEVLMEHQGLHKEESFKVLEASWNLNQSLKDRHDLISQLIGINIARIQSGLLRKMETADPHWVKRLSERDYSPPILNSIQQEAWVMTEFSRHGAQFEPGKYYFGHLHLLMQPYVMLMQLDASDKTADAIAELKGKDPCSLRPVNSGDVHFDKWNIMGGIQWIKPYDHWIKAGRLRLEDELTLRILQIHALVAKNGKWPNEFSNLSSSFCSGAHWSFDNHDDRTLSIKLEGAPQNALESMQQSTCCLLPNAKEKNLVLPLEFSIATK